MTIRPEIQAILAKSDGLVQQGKQKLATKSGAVGKSLSPTARRVELSELSFPIEKHFSTYRVKQVRTHPSRAEKYRLECFEDLPPPVDIPDCIVIIHNHKSDRPCFTNDGCYRYDR